MATIQIKRGQSVNLPSVSLQAGEPAFSMDTGKLYIGTGTDKILINPDGGEATTATKLSVARKIELTGDAIGSVNFDGSVNVQIQTELKASGVTAGAYPKVTVSEKGIVTAGSSLAASDIPSIPVSKLSDAGDVVTLDAGTAAGNVPVLDTNGKLPESVIPALAINNTFVVSTETAMLALNAQIGDMVVRTDTNENYVLSASPASILANWIKLLHPTDKVTSVNSKTGAVTLAASDVGAVPTTRTVNGKALSANITIVASDVGLGNVANESKATMFASPALTGVPVAPTATAGTNSTQIATCAYVLGQGFLKDTATVDGGTF